LLALRLVSTLRFLHDQLSSTSPDLLRQMLAAFINTLTSAEVAAVCGAPYGMPGPERA
jgi:hypothetical protein